MRYGADPADLVEATRRQAMRAEAFRFDGVAWWIFTTLSERPMGYAVLLRWLRMQSPRLLPEAVGHVVMALAAHQLLAVDHRGRWAAREQRIGLDLTRRAA